MSHLPEDDGPGNGRRGGGEGEGTEDNVNGEDGQTGDEVSQGPGDRHLHWGGEVRLTMDGLGR